MTHTAESIYRKLFDAIRTPRSDAYKAGVLDALRHKRDGAETNCYHTAGTAEFDAYWAGWQEGLNAADRALSDEAQAA